MIFYGLKHIQSRRKSKFEGVTPVHLILELPRYNSTKNKVMLTYPEKKVKIWRVFFTIFRFLTLMLKFFGNWFLGCGYQNGLIFCIQPLNIIPQVPTERYFKIFVQLLKKCDFLKKKVKKGSKFYEKVKIVARRQKFQNISLWAPGESCWEVVYKKLDHSENHSLRGSFPKHFT